MRAKSGKPIQLQKECSTTTVASCRAANGEHERLRRSKPADCLGRQAACDGADGYVPL